MQRDVYMERGNEKRCIYMKRDVYISNEMYVYEK